MAVPTIPNAIALTAIQTEFGGSNPISISEYYSGAGLVPGGTANATSVVIPTSGTIRFSNFSGAVKFVGFTADYFCGNTDVTITAPSGATSVTIYLVGGGGGGASFDPFETSDVGGGGGGAGYTVYTTSVSGGSTQFTFTVGCGGAGGGSGPSYGGGDSGSPSSVASGVTLLAVADAGNGASGTSGASGGSYFGGTGVNGNDGTAGTGGSGNTWTNLVACCQKCNLKKGDKTPEEARMHLRVKPYEPGYMAENSVLS